VPNRARCYAGVTALFLSAHSLASAQAYDPTFESPLSLLTAPAAPLAYYDARAKVRALIGQERYAEAEPLAEKITREYPRDGENWLLLGVVKRALKKYPEAAAANERAGPRLRWGSDESAAAGAATAHLLAGNRRAALDMLRHYSVAEGNMDRSWIYDDEDFVGLRGDAEFREIAGRPDTSGWSRDYGWRQDVDFLRSEVKRLNAEYRGAPLPAEFERRYEELKQKVPQLSDEEIFVGMNRMLAVLGQGHTQLTIPKDGRLPAKALPFQVYVFPEGIFIIDAALDHKGLVGARLISIEGVPAEDALRRVNETQSVDGDNEHLMFGTQRLRPMPYLLGLGIAKSADAVRIAVQKPGGAKRNITVGTAPFDAALTLVPPTGARTPLFLRDLKQFHWDQPLPEHDALYVQLNALSDEKDETLEQYGLRLRALLTQEAPSNLIVDLRHNGGGSTHLYPELLRTLVGFSIMPGRRVYVLIGRRTYSAAGNLATDLEQLADAVILGEASSECCTLYASPSPFTLPFSKVGGRVATKRWSLSRKPADFRREMHPHVPVLITAKDYFAGRDPVMETAFSMIARREAGRPAASK
jgi:tetratricopeptide (TPR) repeat protein